MVSDFVLKWKRRHGIGLKVRPFIPFPRCGRKTSGKYRCRWCRSDWTRKELDKREKERKLILESYPEDIMTELKKIWVIFIG